jgi:hypothetical protein
MGSGCRSCEFKNPVNWSPPSYNETAYMAYWFFKRKRFEGNSPDWPSVECEKFLQYRKLCIALSVLTKMLYTQPKSDMEFCTNRLGCVIDV